MLRSFFLITFLALSCWMCGQNVTVSGAVAGNGTYANLTDAFAALNTNAQAGANITISLLNDTYEGTGTALLNAGNWASIEVLPVGQPRSILGATTPGQPLIDLNGADKVYFNGLLGGQRGLTLYNSTVSNVAGTSTVRLRNGASFNRFRHCRILGASTTPLYGEGGNVVFGTSGPGGNSQNSIRDCALGPGSADLPNKLVICVGINVTAQMNQLDTIANNLMVDCFGANTSSSSLVVASGASAWLVDSNQMYQTAPRTKLAMGGTHQDIVNVMSGDVNTLANTFSNNIIGPQPAPMNGKSVYHITQDGGGYRAITMANGDLYGYSIVANNVIRDIEVNYTGTGNGGNLFTGIQFPSSKGFAMGNQIGSSTDSNAIVVHGNMSGVIGFVGMTAGYGSGQEYSGNQLGGIVVRNTGTGSASFIGLVGGHSLATIGILNNTMGFPNAPIRVQAQGAGSAAIGIVLHEGDLTLTGNTIAYLKADFPSTYTPTSYLTGSFSLAGIVARTTGPMGSKISGNTVHSLHNAHPSARTSVVGIDSRFFIDITGNHVHSLSLNTSAKDAIIIGINLREGDPAVANNMIRLGLDGDGQSITNGYQIIGMRNNYTYPKYDYNSVYIGGSGISDTANTYAVYSLALVGPRRFVNNIFYNARSNGTGTGKHYCILSGGSNQPSQSPPVSNGNDLYAPGIGGAIGHFDGLDHMTLSDWSLATFQDYNSISHDPNFVNPIGNALTGDLHIGPVSPIEGIGVPVNSFPVDIDNQNRAALTPRDVGADAGNFTPLVVAQPEAVLSGNTLSILDGDLSPSAADGTDFGTTLACTAASVYRTFQLRNIGNAGLTLSGFSASGSPAFIAFPTSVGVVQPGQTINLNVQFAPATPGTHTATLTLLSNDQDEGTYTFTVVGIALPDTIAPQPTCQSLNLAIAANGIGTVNATALGAGSTDNCGIASYTASPPQFGCTQLGNRTVQLTVADASGNTATCTASVNVLDTQAPQVSCQPVTLVLDSAGTASLSAAAIHAGSTDNCGIASYTASQTQFTCAQASSQVVQLTVADASGNTASCAALVTLIETAAPEAHCQSATLVLDAVGTASLSTAAIDAGSTDNCSIASLLPSQTLFDCSHVGVQPVTLTVTDGSGNTATCTAQVTVVDTTAPATNCTNLSVTVPSSGAATITPAMVGSATDVCGIGGYQLSQSAFTCGDIGANSVQLIATDLHGNSSTCIATVTVTGTPLSLQLNPPALGPCGHHLSCAGLAHATATASPGGACAPYTYAWSNGQAGATATGLGAGTHSVTVTSADGQQQVQAITITAPDPLIASISSTLSCLGSNTGSASATVSGGQSCQNYSYLWSNGQTTPGIIGLAPGSYQLSVTDAAGCTDTTSITVGNWPARSVAITESQGVLTASSGFVAYQWFDSAGVIPGAVSGQITPLMDGSYYVIATDTNGCSWTSAVYPFIFVGSQAAWPGWADINLYPNPGQGVFRFDLRQALQGPIRVEVADLHGRVLYDERLDALEGSRVFDVSILAAGVYLVRLTGEEGQRVHFHLLRE